MNATDSNSHTDADIRASAGRGVLARARIGVRDSSGTALVEFALVMPVVLIVLFGIVQFALALNSANDETHVANEIARYATVNEDPGGAEALQAWGKKQLDQSALKSGAKVCIEFPEGTEAGKPVKVQITSTTNWLPILKLKEVTATTVTGTAEMRLEALPTTYAAGCA